ncbi:MAG: hypothetical protein R3B70_22900 [Polyangiaceae bacterium]
MLLALVGVSLFGFGLLGLFGFWRLKRHLEAADRRAVRQGRLLRRSHRRAVRAERQTRELLRLARAERDASATSRAKLVDFIDGPPSQRTPVLPSLERANVRSTARSALRSGTP